MHLRYPLFFFLVFIVLLLFHRYKEIDHGMEIISNHKAPANHPMHHRSIGGHWVHKVKHYDLLWIYSWKILYGDSCMCCYFTMFSFCYEIMDKLRCGNQNGFIIIFAFGWISPGPRQWWGTQHIKKCPQSKCRNTLNSCSLFCSVWMVYVTHWFISCFDQ